MSPVPPPLWDDVRREVRLRCDAADTIVWADEAACQQLDARPGRPFAELAAPGLTEKAQGLLARGRAEKATSELPLVAGAQVAVLSFHARPDGEGGVHLLGSWLPEGHADALRQMQQALEEVVALHREVSRQRRELQRQKDQLEGAYRHLYESNKGVLSLHAELADKAASLRHSSEVKARVVANVSHEFRTPLHTILGLSQLLLDVADGPLTVEQRKQVRFIRAAAEELHRLVDEMLDLSKVEAGKMTFRPERFEVEDLFAALRGMLRPLLKNPERVRLVFVEPSAPLQLHTDQGKLSQILRNLVSNALKFTAGGEVRVSAQSQGDQVRFEVTDTGVGIAPEHHERIFEEFGQVEGAHQEGVKGTGLGLALSRKLAELLGGTLEVRSALGEGSTFSCQLPAVHPEVHEMVALESRALDPARAPVLVVEDDRKTLFLYEKYLAMAGFQVVPARDTAAARKVLETVRPAAVVLDVMLEEETTWEFLAGLKQDPRTLDIPVLVVTITNREQKARALGADEFWLKPIDQDRLLRKLKAIAGTHVPGRVLLIDDDDASRYLIRRFIEKSPYELIEAASGQAGLTLAREQRPSVILLDFFLEEQTAFDVLDELKADPRTRGIPVIVVTSHQLPAAERARLANVTEAILSKDSLSREVAIQRIRDVLKKGSEGGVPPPKGSP